MPRSSININFDGSSEGLVRALRDASRSLGNTQNDLRRTRNSLTQTAGVTNRLSQSMQGLQRTLGLGLGVGGLIALTRNAASFGESLNELSRTLGLTTDELQAMQLAARLVNVEFPAMQYSMRRLRFATGEAIQGIGEYEIAFNRLGITMEELPFLTTIQLMRRVSAEIERGGFVGTAEGTSIIRRLFGETGDVLTPLLGLGADNFDRITERATSRPRRSDADLQNLERLNESISEMTYSFGVLRDSIIAQAAPALTALADLLTDVVDVGTRVGRETPGAGDFSPAGLASFVAGAVLRAVNSDGDPLNESTVGRGGGVEGALPRRFNAVLEQRVELLAETEQRELRALRAQERSLTLHEAELRDQAQINAEFELRENIENRIFAQQRAARAAEAKEDAEALSRANQRIGALRSLLARTHEIVEANQDLIDAESRGQVLQSQVEAGLGARELAPPALTQQVRDRLLNASISAIATSIEAFQLAPPPSSRIQSAQRALTDYFELIDSFEGVQLAPPSISEFESAQRSSAALRDLIEGFAGLELAPPSISEFESAQRSEQALRELLTGFEGLELAPPGLTEFESARRTTQALFETINSLAGFELAPPGLSDFESARRTTRALFETISGLAGFELAPPGLTELESTRRTTRALFETINSLAGFELAPPGLSEFESARRTTQALFETIDGFSGLELAPPGLTEFESTRRTTEALFETINSLAGFQLAPPSLTEFESARRATQALFETISAFEGLELAPPGLTEFESTQRAERELGDLIRGFAGLQLAPPSEAEFESAQRATEQLFNLIEGFEGLALGPSPISEFQSDQLADAALRALIEGFEGLQLAPPSVSQNQSDQLAETTFFALIDSFEGMQLGPPSISSFQSDQMAERTFRALINSFEGMQLAPPTVSQLQSDQLADRALFALIESFENLELAPSNISEFRSNQLADAALRSLIAGFEGLQLAPTNISEFQSNQLADAALRALIAGFEGLQLAPPNISEFQSNQFAESAFRALIGSFEGLQLAPPALGGLQLGQTIDATTRRQDTERTVAELEATQAAQSAVQSLNDEHDRTIDQLLIQIRLREEEQIVGTQARRAHRIETLQIQDAQKLTAQLTSRQINLENQLEVARAAGNAEQIKAIELQQDATQRELNNIDTLIASRTGYYERVERLQSELEQSQNRSLKRIAETLDDTLNAGLQDALSGTDNLKRAFEELAVSIAEAAIEFAFFGSNGQTPGRSLGEQIVGGLVGSVFDEGFSGIFNSDIPSAEVGTTAAQGGLPGGGGANYVQNFYINNSDEATVRRGLNNALPAIQDATAGRVAQDLTRPSTIRQSATGG